MALSMSTAAMSAAVVKVSVPRTRLRAEAPSRIGGNVTGVQGDSGNLDDLDRLFDTVKQDNTLYSDDAQFNSASTLLSKRPACRALR
jgi:hypothetical protein